VARDVVHIPLITRIPWEPLCLCANGVNMQKLVRAAHDSLREQDYLLQQTERIYNMSESKGMGKVGVWNISDSTETIIKPVH